MRLVFVAALAIASFAIPAPAFAQEEDGCATLGLLAHNIMEARQSGMVMSAMMATMKSDPNNPFADLAVALVKDAYSEPQFSTDANKARAAIEFRNDTELACYKAGS